MFTNHKAFHELTKILGFTPARVEAIVEVALSKIQIDISKFDYQLEQHSDLKYNHVECTYEGEPCSIMEYINIRYGIQAVDWCEQCL